MKESTATSPVQPRPAVLITFVAALAVLWLALAAPSARAQAPEDKALGQPATASSVEQQRGGTCRNGICTPDKANDGRADTRWSSAFSDPQYWQVDLGRPRLVDTVSVDWQFAYAANYTVSTSLDGVTFAPAATVSLPLGLGVDLVPASTQFAARSARFVRISGSQRATQYGYSIWTASVYGPDDATAPPPPSPSPTPAPTPRPPEPGTPAPAEPARELRPISATTVVRLRGRLTRRGAAIAMLSVRAPRRATVRVRCTGSSCPQRVVRARGSHRFPQFHRAFRAGTVLEVFVTQPGTYGKYTRFVIRRKREPKRVDRCLIGGRPSRCPG